MKKTMVLYLDLEPMERWYTMRVDVELIAEFKALMEKAAEQVGAIVEWNEEPHNVL